MVSVFDILTTLNRRRFLFYQEWVCVSASYGFLLLTVLLRRSLHRLSADVLGLIHLLRRQDRHCYYSHIRHKQNLLAWTEGKQITKLVYVADDFSEFDTLEEYNEHQEKIVDMKGLIDDHFLRFKHVMTAKKT